MATSLLALLDDIASVFDDVSILHGIPMTHHLTDQIDAAFDTIPAIGPALSVIAPLLINALAGLLAGAAALALYSPVQRMLGKE